MLRCCSRLLCIGVLLAVAGCSGPADPLDAPIDAESDRDYNRWMYRHGGRLDRSVRERFEVAGQQLRLELLVAYPGTPSDEIREQQQALFNGATPRQVIVFAELVQVARSDLENLADSRLLDANNYQLANVRPGSDASISRSIREQIEAIEKRMISRRQQRDAMLDAARQLVPGMELDVWSNRPRQFKEKPLLLVQEQFSHPSLIQP